MGWRNSGGIAHRANNFDALRLIAALMVLQSHIGPAMGLPVQLVWQGESAGSLGVLIFFSISGYLVAASWGSDPDLGRFLARRFLRIAPGLMVCGAITWAWTAALGLHPKALNQPLWTIPYEVKCYLLLAAAGLLVKRPGAALALAMLVGFLALSATHMVEFGLLFGMGALLHEFPGLRSRWLSGALIAAGLVLIYGLHGEPFVGKLLIVPALAIGIGSQSWPAFRSVGRALGDISFGVYIYAWPVQNVVVSLGLSYAATLGLTLVITLALGWLSWRFVEKPMLARKPVRNPETAGRIMAACTATPDPPPTPSADLPR